ncbi:hypothetical protein, partial [Fournierella massiliensis]
MLVNDPTRGYGIFAQTNAGNSGYIGDARQIQ